MRGFISLVFLQAYRNQNRKTPARELIAGPPLTLRRHMPRLPLGHENAVASNDRSAPGISEPILPYSNDRFGSDAAQKSDRRGMFGGKRTAPRIPSREDRIEHTRCQVRTQPTGMPAVLCPELESRAAAERLGPGEADGSHSRAQLGGKIRVAALQTPCIPR
jgi:hypothetical protein